MFGVVLGEAFAHGTPVLTSSIGSFPELVEDSKCGAMFETGSPDSLVQQVAALWQSQDKLRRFGENSRREFEEKYTEDANYNRLVGIYEAAVRFNQNSK